MLFHEPMCTLDAEVFDALKKIASGADTHPHEHIWTDVEHGWIVQRCEVLALKKIAISIFVILYKILGAP